MGERGQITIEALLIFGMFILLFVGITFPGMLNVYRDSNDATVVLEGKKNLEAIATGIVMVRNGGPGAVKTVPITSNVKNWGISTYDSGYTLVYWIKWNSPSDVPGLLIKKGSEGGMGIVSFDGIASSGSSSSYYFNADNGQGRWYVKIENSANSSNSSLTISNTLENGNTIKVTIQ